MTAPRGRVIVAITHTTAGGLRELWQDLAQGLRQRGFAVELLALYPSSAEEGREMRALGWQFMAPARPRGPLSTARMIIATWATMRRAGRCRVISAMPLANALLAVLGRLGGGARIIPTQHIPVNANKGLSAWLDRRASHLSSVYRIVAVSHAVERSMQAMAPALTPRLMTITNALPDALDRELADLRAARMAASPPAGPARLVALGRLAEQKNYPVILRAMALVPDAILDIFGEGEDEAALRALADELGIAERVIFHGLQPRSHTLRQASTAAAFLQMSLYEGHSLALIEAAKLGLALIVSDVESQIEGVTDNRGRVCGLVVPCRDHHALAKTIRMLLDDPAERAKWTIMAQDLGDCSRMDTMIAQYEALILHGEPVAGGRP